jgi:hypothetical protein
MALIALIVGISVPCPSRDDPADRRLRLALSSCKRTFNTQPAMAGVMILSVIV